MAVKCCFVCVCQVAPVTLMNGHFMRLSTGMVEQRKLVGEVATAMDTVVKWIWEDVARVIEESQLKEKVLIAVRTFKSLVGTGCTLMDLKRLLMAEGLTAHVAPKRRVNPRCILAAHFTKCFRCQDSVELAFVMR